MVKKAQEQGDFFLAKKRNDEFIASLLHDIKSPMISMNIALVDNLHTELLRDIYKINLWNLNFVENLLHTYNFETANAEIKLKIVDISQVLEEQIEIYKYLLKERGLSVSVSGFKTLKPIQACPVCMGRIFSNLISNAQKYALSGSKIKIKAKASKKHVLFEFTNSLQTCGKGFHNDIFDKFYTENVLYSQGLGLYICRRIIENLGGKIWLKSTQDKVTFYIGLKL